MSSSRSVTQWIEDVKAGNEEAARQIWERFFAQLIDEARKRLPRKARIVADEVDVVVDAFHSFFRRAQEGRFPDLNDRDSLWLLLLTIVERKAINEAVKQGRGIRGGDQRRAPAEVIELIAGGQPTPDLVVMVADEFQFLLGLLKDQDLVRVVLLRLEDYTVREISETLNCSERTVFRRLDLIRKAWEWRLTS
jgi:DNA-directed RNA polymerase specialized sigma24 family protein